MIDFRHFLEKAESRRRFYSSHEKKSKSTITIDSDDLGTATAGNPKPFIIQMGGRIEGLASLIKAVSFCCLSSHGSEETLRWSKKWNSMFVYFKR